MDDEIVYFKITNVQLLVIMYSLNLFKENKSFHVRNEEFWHSKEAHLFQNAGKYCSRPFLLKMLWRIQHRVRLSSSLTGSQSNSALVGMSVAYSLPNLHVTAHLHDKGRAAVRLQDTHRKL